MSNIAVVGTGYVGLVTGTCFADLGNNVVCMDVLEDKIQNSNRVCRRSMNRDWRRCFNVTRRQAGSAFTTSYAKALKDAEFVFIAVGTPDPRMARRTCAMWKWRRARLESTLPATSTASGHRQQEHSTYGTGDLVGKLVGGVPQRFQVCGRVEPRVSPGGASAVRFPAT